MQFMIEQRGFSMIKSYMCVGCKAISTVGFDSHENIIKKVTVIRLNATSVVGYHSCLLGLACNLKEINSGVETGEIEEVLE